MERDEAVKQAERKALKERTLGLAGGTAFQLWTT